MRVREWQDVVRDVVAADAEPEGWRAVGGDRAGGLGEDLYLGHPGVGVFHLKTYAKHPREVRGVGTRVARSIDDEIGRYLPSGDGDGRFAVRTPPEDEAEAERTADELAAVLEAHASAPTTPEDLFDDVMETLDSPAFGPMEYEMADRPAALDDLSTTFEDAEDVLNTELDDLIDEDRVGKGFR